MSDHNEPGSAATAVAADPSTFRGGDRAKPVWMLTGSFYPLVGGAEVQVYLVTKLLLARGWRVSVITRRHGHPVLRGTPRKEVHDGVPIRRVANLFSNKLGSFLYLLAGYWALLIRGRSSIYHAHYPGAPAFLAIAARYLLRGRCLVTFQSGADAYRRSHGSFIRRRHLRLLFRLVDRLVVVNQDVERFLLHCGAPRTKVELIRNGVDTSFFRPPSTSEKARARARLNIDPAKTAVIYVGRLEPVKGADVLVSAWKGLPRDVLSRLVLVVVGDGSERTRLSDTIRRAGLKGSINLAGMQPAVREYYWAADLFVLPSRSEGLPNSLIEAMACGLPVLASDLPGCREILTDGVNGATCQPDDAGSLREALASLISQRERWPDLGAQARATVMSRASLSETANRLDRLYTQLESALKG